MNEHIKNMKIIYVLPISIIILIEKWPDGEFYGAPLAPPSQCCIASILLLFCFYRQ